MHHKHRGILFYAVSKISQSRRLMTVLILSCLTLVALGVLLLFILTPYVFQFISLIEKQGIKGILDAIAPVLKLIWEGSGK